MLAEFFPDTRRLAAALAVLFVTSGPLMAQRTTRPRPTTAPAAPAGPVSAANNQLAAYLAGSLGVTSLSWWNGVVTPDYPHKNTYGKQPVYVDWTRKNLAWWVHWTTTTPSTSALWQVSTVPFPQSLGANWAKPLGLRASGKVPNVPPPGVARTFSIDLSKIAPRPTWWTALSASTSAVSGSSVRPAILTPAAPTTRSGARLRLPTNRSQPSLGGGDAASNAGSAGLALPAALYIRIVTLDAKGNPFTASNTAMLTFGPPKPQAPPATLSLASFEMPNARIVKWIPPQPYAQDVQCWVMATRNVTWMGQKTLWAKGQKINVCAKKDDDDFFDDFGDALGGSIESFVDIAEGAVNWMAGVYNDLKQEAINTIVSGLKATVGCGSECQFALKTAVDAGLAAMGVPPSIPNFDQLVAQLEEQGVEYLAGAMVSAAASQGVPVPQQLAENAIEEFVEQAKQAASGSGSGAPLFVPDPDRIYRPAVLVVEFRNTGAGAGAGAAATRPTALTILQKGRTHYADMVFHAPSLDKGETIRVPLFLTPIDDPEAWRQSLEAVKGTIVNVGAALQAHQQAQAIIAGWKTKYSTGKLAFELTLTNEIKVAGAAGTTCQAGAALCSP